MKINKKKYKINCLNLNLFGTIAIATSHFLTCVLPSLLIMTNTIPSVSDSFLVNFMTHRQKSYLLAISGLFLTISLVSLYRNRLCSSKCKYFKFKKIILIIAFLFFLMGVYFHFNLKTMNCH